MACIINANNSGLIITTDLTATVNFQTANTTALSIDSSQNANVASTGAIIVPIGTTAQRPTATNGMVRYSTSNSSFEVYTNSSWKTKTLTYLPVNSVAPVISGGTAVGSTLTSTTGTWSNSPTSYGYQWRANAVAIVANATANTFVLTSTQVGATITCNVTAINAAGNSTPATSNSLGPVTSTYTASYLVVAGGGAGAYGCGSQGGGGGGAGGMRESTYTVTPGTTYTITVGGGGSFSGGPCGASSGTGSSIAGISSTVGGGRGGYSYGCGIAQGGASGGSGGGGGRYCQPGGSGTSGEGNAGGANVGGGGGKGGGGGYGGNGGSGGFSSITGSSVGYAGGGGGGNGGSYCAASGGGSPGSGGGGGGGNGGTNKGGGGGGGGGNNGGQGGKGVVILSVPTASYSGVTTGSPQVIINGSNTVLRYTDSGTYRG